MSRYVWSTFLYKELVYDLLQIFTLRMRRRTTKYLCKHASKCPNVNLSRQVKRLGKTFWSHVHRRSLQIVLGSRVIIRSILAIEVMSQTEIYNFRFTRWASFK